MANQRLINIRGAILDVNSITLVNHIESRITKINLFHKHTEVRCFVVVAESSNIIVWEEADGIEGLEALRQWVIDKWSSYNSIETFNYIK